MQLVACLFFNRGVDETAFFVKDSKIIFIWILIEVLAVPTDKVRPINLEQPQGVVKLGKLRENLSIACV
jgi:hypothetical protein